MTNLDPITARVLLALPKDDPLPAEQIAVRANLGRNQTYQALVHLNDRGLAFMVGGAGNAYHAIEGWTS